MYNEELKEKFISWYTKSEYTKKACVAVFKACEKYELHWGADLCTRSTEDLQKMSEQIVGLREEGRKIRITMLRAYSKWCVEHGIEGAIDGMNGVDVTGVGKLRTQSVRNPLHLQRYLDTVFDKESDRTMDNVYRCFHWLAYAGMKEEDIVRAKTSDVDLQNMVILLENTEYPIYREALPCFHVCVEQEQFRYIHDNPSYECMRDRYKSDRLLRCIKADPSITEIKSKISKRTKTAFDEGKTDMRLSYYRIWISGIFYRKYEQEMAGIPADFTDIAWADMQGKTYKLDIGRNTVSAKMRQLRKQYDIDYANWKQTFLV